VHSKTEFQQQEFFVDQEPVANDFAVQKVPFLYKNF